MVAEVKKRMTLINIPYLINGPMAAERAEVAKLIR